MKFHKLPLLASALVCMIASSFADGQTPAPVASAPVVAVAEAPVSAQISEEELHARYVGKFIYLRQSYMGNELNYDMDGKIKGSPAPGSFTLSALKVTKVSLSKHKLEIEADRYGLHFLAAVPYEDDGKSLDKVKISKKPMHITIERELIVIPKVKKEKKKKGETSEPPLTATQTAPPPAAQTVPAPAAPAAPAVGTVTAAQSATLLNKALDSILASDIDPRMLAHLPDYWQEYFKSQNQHRAFMPADASIKLVSDGVVAPKVLNAIDPTSNEYAQQFDIAGMDVLRTVVDANGVPRQIAIDRPIGFGLDEKAVDAVKNSHFRPATLNGQPVPVVIDLVVTFRIYSDGTQPGVVAQGPKGAVLAASSGGKRYQSQPLSHRQHPSWPPKVMKNCFPVTDLNGVATSPLSSRPERSVVEGSQLPQTFRACFSRELGWPSWPPKVMKNCFPVTDLNGVANLPFVIPTGAKRSGGISVAANLSGMFFESVVE